MRRQNLDSDGLPVVVERRERTVKWRYLIPPIAVLVLVMNWSLISDYASEQLESIKQAESNQVKKDSKAQPGDDKNASGFEDVLHTALRYDREGKRVLAATLFQELLRQAAQNPGYNEQLAALLPRAADFSDGEMRSPKSRLKFFTRMPISPSSRYMVRIIMIMKTFIADWRNII